MRASDIPGSSVHASNGAALTDHHTLSDILLSNGLALAWLAEAFSSLRLSLPRDPCRQALLSTAPEIYRLLIEQNPSIVFIASFDKSFGEAYVNPQIETILGFTQKQWLDDPVRWYQQIHPGDRERWGAEVTKMLLTGEPLRSAYRVFSRDGRIVTFQCDVRIVSRSDGQPWFVHGSALDITQQQRNEEAMRVYADWMEFLSRRLIEVQEAERRKIALELHDQIGQILTGLKLKLEMLARSADRNSTRGFDEAQDLVNELMTRTRSLSLDLRPATLDHLGLLSALIRHVKEYNSRTGVEVAFNHDGIEGRRFSPELETAAFRIVQEALTNIARHSCSRVAIINIQADNEGFTIEVTDRGVGFSIEKSLMDDRTSGIAGMRERVSLLGGRFEIESGQDGTRLLAKWPLPRS